jgi:S-adenosylmethionine:tRNA-ribosyltransferase-isomerase (queuine synthetase)
MKLKYMLRGLGIGVVVTAAIMGAYTRNVVAETKAQARVDVLNEYGFGEEPTLVENESEAIESEVSESVSETEETIPIIVRDESKESEVESVIESAKEAEKETEAEPESGGSEVESSAGEAKATEIKSEVESEVKSETAVSKKSEVKSETESESESVSVPSYIDANDVVEVPETIDITVSKGDDSGTVSRKLYNAGIVDSASEYDAYLMQHGYDKRISVGTKTINITDTWQEIAEKLTSK